MGQNTVQMAGIGLLLLAYISAPIPLSAATTPPPGTVAQLKQYNFDTQLDSRSLRQGDRGNDVISLQRALDREGLYTELFDGIYGPATTTAVREFQQQNGLAITGNADSTTLERLGLVLPGEALAATPTRTNYAGQGGTLVRSQLVRGNSGEDVVLLQRALNANGARLTEDGDYGAATEQAVSDFQRRQRLPVTGTADSRTLEALGFNRQRNRYVAAIIENASQLAEIQRIYPNATVDSVHQGSFINIGSYPTRAAATERVDAARNRGLDARVLYR